MTNICFCEPVFTPGYFGPVYVRDKRQADGGGVVNPYAAHVIPNLPYSPYHQPENDVSYASNHLQFQNRFQPSPYGAVGYSYQRPLLPDPVNLNEPKTNIDDNEYPTKKGQFFKFPPDRPLNKRDALIRPAKLPRLSPAAALRQKNQPKYPYPPPCGECTKYGPREIFGY